LIKQLLNVFVGENFDSTKARTTLLLSSLSVTGLTPSNTAVSVR